MSYARLAEPSKPVAIDKTPTCCPTPDEFQSGDILIFNINPRSSKPSAHPTVIAQKLYNTSGGHKDAVHAAFVVEIDGQKKIAHLRASGFVLDDVSMIKTVTHIYRPRIFQKNIADEISTYIQSHADELKKRLRWKNVTSVLSFIRRLASAVGIKSSDTAKLTTPVAKPELLPTQDRFISSWSICSKFLTESYASSCYSLSRKTGQDFRSQLMNITSNTLPKTLQAYLYRCSNYNYLVMPKIDARGKILKDLINTIQQEIERLLATGQTKSTEKAAGLQKEIDKCNSPEEKSEVMSNTDQIKFDFEQAKTLLRNVIPILKFNTGKNVKTPTSYKHVMDYANSNGLYAHYLESDLKFNSATPDLTKEAKETYHYNDKVASQYSKYRELGYSDEEARFECKPSLWDWMKINSRRNTAAAITILPFLLWSIPYGLSRVLKSQNRNDALGKNEVNATPTCLRN